MMVEIFRERKKTQMGMIIFLPRQGFSVKFYVACKSSSLNSPFHIGQCFKAIKWENSNNFLNSERSLTSIQIVRTNN